MTAAGEAPGPAIPLATIPLATIPLAAGQGDVRAQLRHLRGHLAFQRQDRHELLRVDWATTITREQSRRHITRDLHAKINLKGGLAEPRGRQDRTETGRMLRRTGRMMRNHERLSGGDLCGLSERLRSRIQLAADAPQARRPRGGTGAGMTAE